MNNDYRTRKIRTDIKLKYNEDIEIEDGLNQIFEYTKDIEIEKIGLNDKMDDYEEFDKINSENYKPITDFGLYISSATGTIDDYLMSTGLARNIKIDEEINMN